MDHPASYRALFFKAFVCLVAYLACTGWLLSYVHKLHWLGWAGLMGLAVMLFAMRREITRHDFWKSLASPLIYWPFLLVVALALLGQVLYPPTMLDSLTYRLPRLFIWLQNDSLQHFTTAEERLNYMPQTWGLATLPLVQLAGDRLVFLWALGSWLILYLLAYDWALDAGGEEKKSRQLAFIAGTSTFAVLQGASSASDLFAAVMALLALRFIVDFERNRDWWNIHWAVLSFCIAGGTKPHFSVFGLPLLAWFFVSPSKPWKAFRWVWLPGLLVVWLLCSTAPCFFLNYENYGSWGGPGQDYSMKGRGPGWNILMGDWMILWQNPQPPANPLALVCNERLEKFTENSGIKELVPRFNLQLPVVSMVDSAALGLVTSVVFLAGVILAFRKNPRGLTSWQGMAAISALVSIEIALSHFVSGSSGRAYCGFLYQMLPLALVGWSTFTPRVTRWVVIFSLASSLVSLVLNPSKPLWPARWVQAELAASARFHGLAEKMTPYLQFPERAVTGQDLIRAITGEHPRILLLVGDDRPLLPLLRPYSDKRELLFLPRNSGPKDLARLSVDFIVVGGAEEAYPALCRYLEKSPDYELIFSRDYTSKLVRGTETWKLYWRVNAVPAAGGGEQ